MVNGIRRLILWFCLGFQAISFIFVTVVGAIILIGICNIVSTYLGMWFSLGIVVFLIIICIGIMRDDTF